MSEPLQIQDDDGDSLRAKPVGGFGQPMLAVFVTQEGAECGMNLGVTNAEQLRDYLDAFVEAVAEKEAEEKAKIWRVEQEWADEVCRRLGLGGVVNRKQTLNAFKSALRDQHRQTGGVYIYKPADRWEHWILPPVHVIRLPPDAEHPHGRYRIHAWIAGGDHIADESEVLHFPLLLETHV